jgi:hypothetical protein
MVAAAGCAPAAEEPSAVSDVSGEKAVGDREENTACTFWDSDAGSNFHFAIAHG